MNYNFTPVIDNDVMFELPKITAIQVNSSETLIEKINNFNFSTSFFLRDI